MTVLIILLAILITTIIFVILNNIFGRLLDGICSFIGAIPIIGDIKDIIFLFISFFLTAIIMTIGFKMFNLEIHISHPIESTIGTIQTDKVSHEGIISKFQYINAEENKMFESFHKLNDKEIEDNFAEFYRKNIINYRQSYAFDSPTKLIADLNKLNLKYYEDKELKTITFMDIPLFVYSYNESFEGFIPDFEYLIEKYTRVLSPAWMSYFRLSLEEEKDALDINKYPPNEDGVRLDFCKKWYQKWQDFLYKYPDFPLKKEIDENISSNADLLKTYGGF